MTTCACGGGLIFQQIGEDEIVGGRQVLASELGGQRGITAFDSGKDATVFRHEVLGLTDLLEVDIQIAVGETSQSFDELDHPRAVRVLVDRCVKFSIGGQ